METKQKSVALIIILVVAGAVIFALGGLSGILYQNQKITGSPGAIGSIVTPGGSLSKASASVKSKVITSLTLFGQVKSISGETLTLISNGDTLQVNVTNATKYFTVDYTKGAPDSKNGQFSSVKVGSNLNINAKILDNDTFSAQSVMIYITK